MLHTFLEDLIFNPTWQKSCIAIVVAIALFNIFLILPIVFGIYDEICKWLKQNTKLAIAFSVCIFFLATFALIVYTSPSSNGDKEMQRPLPQQNEDNITPHTRKHSA